MEAINKTPAVGLLERGQRLCQIKMHSNVEGNSGQILTVDGKLGPDGMVPVITSACELDELHTSDPVWVLEPQEPSNASFGDLIRSRQAVRCKIKMAFANCQYGLTGHERINHGSCRVITHAPRGTERDEPIWVLEHVQGQQDGWIQIKMVSNVEGQQGYWLTAPQNDGGKSTCFGAAVTSSNTEGVDTMWQLESVDEQGENHFRIRRGSSSYLTIGSSRNASSWRVVVAPLSPKADLQNMAAKAQETAWEILPVANAVPNCCQIRLSSSNLGPLYLSASVPRNDGSWRVVAQPNPPHHLAWQLEQPPPLCDPYWKIRLVDAEGQQISLEQRGTRQRNRDGFGLTTHERTESEEGLSACKVIVHRLRGEERDLPVWQIEDLTLRIITCSLLPMSSLEEVQLVQCRSLSGEELATFELPDTVLSLRAALATHLGERMSRLRLLGSSQTPLKDDEGVLMALTDAKPCVDATS